ncbi:MAG TPA: alpha/beta fold hydrolase [Candidatus Paceibacterota bacterium]|nr:alpha/beta fold hydrolase [Candidatus Paceibacterota bacterium]
MSEIIRANTVLPAIRTPFTVLTEDGLKLIGEVARPTGESKGAILCLHPLPTAGGMMDSHIYRKAANRLPELAGITVVRFNTRGTESDAGKSEGEFDNGVSERLDIEAMLRYCFDELKLSNLWVVGWSFGTDLALQHAKDSRHKGLILLSPPLRTSTPEQLAYWNSDQRPIIALIPELDDYLQPPQARERFSVIPHAQLIAVEGAKHLWVGEPSVYRVLSEIVKCVAPERLPLPTQF